MGKNKRRKPPVINNVSLNQENESSVDTGRGTINDNALKALVTSKLFTSKIEKAKKGKGSFQRKAKHRGKEPYSKAA
ncbi:ribosome alternative rescue factor ArfA [Vibrio hannami]|uniref:alternative ribosome-rescue factor A n=1 Tax=Vibrio hannami TaxID=2717094 RepID=UPI00240F4114|nr:ribosome alternative rescue factor ArfA [Vibrio hannami]MDG3085389.1 ribosome alternative rescue factor ArfA [Vibrio hannami]